MDITRWAQYFNDIAVEAYKKTASVVKPDGALQFINQGTPITDCVDWTWRICARIPEDVVAVVGLTLKPNPLGLGFGLILTVFAHKGEERRGLEETYWARFVGLEYLQYDSGKFKKDLTEEIAFQLRLACEYLVMVAPRLGEIPANMEDIKVEMRALNYTLHRAE